MIYEEDHFHPLEKNENDELSINNKNVLNDIKKLDTGYHKITRKLNKVWIDGKYYKNINFECYTSSDTGNKIRNAVTGYRTAYKVGSIDEDMFFKVKLLNNSVKKGSGHLFYDSPEQFEKHQYSILNQHVKEQWYNKQIKTKTHQL